MYYMDIRHYTRQLMLARQDTILCNMKLIELYYAKG
jgi:hypothetical protein